MSTIERKLASLRKISSIDPIENADNLEVATVDGWKVVVQKGKHTVGEKIIYFEIDSFLPIMPWFEFLRKSSYRKVEGFGEGFRIKTIRLRGQISQGLIMKPEEIGDHPDFFWFSEVADEILPFVPDQDLPYDVTGYIGVIKYDPPANATALGVDQAGLFPHFVPKTDQERIQNIFGQYHSKYMNDYFEVTMKLDGTSMTVFYNEGNFGVCSRNFELKEGDNAYWQVVKLKELDKKLEVLGINLAIQGELMGPGIQKNREKLMKHEFYVFDVYLIDRHEYLTPAKRRELIEDLGLSHVPVLSAAKPMPDSVENALIDADIPSMSHTVAEGLVYKHILEPSVSFKVINNKFLLKCED
jgi:RNA ligase (TIGR02306 family)